MNISKRIEYYSRAAYPALMIPTHEEARITREIVHGLSQITQPGDGDEPEPARRLYVWSCTEGLARHDQEEQGDPEMNDPVEVLETFIHKSVRGTVFILRDFHLFLEDAAPMIVRLFRDAIEMAKTQGNMLILIGCRIVLPPEVEKLVTVVDFKLPTAEELAEVVLDPLAESVGVELNDAERQELAEAGGGLTTYEFQDALALSYVETKAEQGTPRLCSRVVYREKVQTVKKSGLLEVVETDINPEDLGGLDQFKSWMNNRRQLFGQEARDFGLQWPKGVLLVGVPGCGKSLAAKVSAKMLGDIPLLKCDLGKMFAGVVGASEQNMRQMLEVAESMSPCCLWLDEIERGLSGSESSGKTDGGTTDRMIGTLLNWMQDKTRPVFIFATGNDVTSLPAQLLRKGRFDELWFVDLPNYTEREEIWKIVIRRTGRDPDDYLMSQLADETDGWTGSEIESLWEESLIEAFAKGERSPSQGTISRLAANTTPLSKSQAQKIQNMRKWAEAQARPATSMPKKRQSLNGQRALN